MADTSATLGSVCLGRSVSLKEVREEDLASWPPMLIRRPWGNHDFIWMNSPAIPWATCRNPSKVKFYLGNQNYISKKKSSAAPNWFLFRDTSHLWRLCWNSICFAMSFSIKLEKENWTIQKCGLKRTNSKNKRRLKTSFSKSHEPKRSGRREIMKYI